MKSTTFLVIFYGVSLAQNSIIGTPTVGQKLTRDRKTVVQVERPVRCFLETQNVKCKVILTCPLELLDWLCGDCGCDWHFLLRIHSLPVRRRGHGYNSLPWGLRSSVLRGEPASLPKFHCYSSQLDRYRQCADQYRPRGSCRSKYRYPDTYGLASIC